MFVRNDEICRKLDSKKKGRKYQAKPKKVLGNLLLRTSSAGFHHISTKITLLQAVKLRPTSQANNKTSSLPSKGLRTSASCLERNQDDPSCRTRLDFSKRRLAILWIHRAIIYILMMDKKSHKIFPVKPTHIGHI